MSRAKGFNDFSYGVGLEYNASSYKQVKDALKNNLDGLKQLADAYNKMIKLDPNTDLSTVIKEFKEVKHFVDQIKGSGNPFSEFVDKGVLNRIASLEQKMQVLISKSAELKASMEQAFSGIKDVGSNKYIGSFNKIFAYKSGEITKLKDEIRSLDKLITQFSQKKDNGIEDLLIQKTAGIPENIKQFEDLQKQYSKLINSFNANKGNLTEQINLIQPIQKISSQLYQALENSEIDELLNKKLDAKQYDKLCNSLTKNLTNSIDLVIKGIAEKKAALQAELSGLLQIQENYKLQQGNNLKGVSDSGQSATVKTLPNVDPSEWAGIINQKISQVEDKLNSIKLRPTFSNVSKTLEKDLEGNIAAINHTIKMEFNIDDSTFLAKFNEKIKSIDKAITDAKEKLKGNTTFKLNFAFEGDGGKQITNVRTYLQGQFKNIHATITLQNKDTFIKSIKTIRENIDSELANIGSNLDIKSITDKLSNIPVTLEVGNKDALLSEIDNIRKSIEAKLSNIKVGSQSTLQQTDNINNLSEASKMAQTEIDKIQNALAELNGKNAFNSKTFASLAMITPDGKQRAGSKEQVAAMVQEYNELVKKTNGSMDKIQKTYNAKEIGLFEANKAYLADATRRMQLETDLNNILQIQIAYTQQQLKLAQEKFVVESKIASPISQQNQSNNISMMAEDASNKYDQLAQKIERIKVILNDLNTNGSKSSWFTKIGEWDGETGSFKKNAEEITQLIAKYNELRALNQQTNIIDKNKSQLTGDQLSKLQEEHSLRGKIASIVKQQKQHISEVLVAQEKELALVKSTSAAQQQSKSVKQQISTQTTTSTQQQKTIDTTQNKIATTTQIKNETKAVEALNDAWGKPHSSALTNAVKAEESKKRKSRELTIQLHEELKALKAISKLGGSRSTQSSNGQKTKEVVPTYLKQAIAQSNKAESLINILNQSNISTNRSTASQQVQNLVNVYNKLKKAIASKFSQSTIEKLTKDTQLATTEVNRLYRLVSKMNGALAVNSLSNETYSKSNTINPTGNIEEQLRNYAKETIPVSKDSVLNFTNFNEATNTLTASVVKGGKAMQNYTIQMSDMNGAVKTTRTGVTQITNTFDDFKAGLSSIGKQMMTALVGYNVFFKMISMIQQGINYVKEIDSAMTELKKVTDETRSTYVQFLNTTSKTAANIGSTISDFTEATANFARLGYTIEESSSMAQAAIIYKNVADDIDSVDEATESIISTMKAFGIESNSVISIVDKYNEVGNRFAITSGGIGEAMERSASALYEAGNTIDESIGLITAANSVIQNPEQVGTALKTLTLRLRGAKVELEEAGLETENMASTTASLQAKLKALTGGKVDILTDTDSFKSTTQILREDLQVWEEMTDIEQASALELMGGKRQANILASLIANFETVEDVIAASTDSAGSAAKENAKWMNSIEGKSQQLTNSMQDLWNSTINSDVVKFFLDIANGVAKFTKTIGVLPTILGAVLVYFTAIKKKSPKKLFEDMALSVKSYVTTQRQMVALKGVQLDWGESGTPQYQAAAQNYANILSTLTPKLQAAKMAQLGFNREQAAAVLACNGVTEAEREKILTQAGLTLSTKTLKTVTEQDAIASLMNAKSTEISISADRKKQLAQLQATLGTKKLTAEKLKDLLATKQLTTSEYLWLVANHQLAFSFKTLGAAMKSAFMSNIVGWIMMAITAIISILNAVEQAREEVHQAAEDIITEYNNMQDTLKSNKTTLKDIASEYHELSKGVNELGENLTLSTDEYERYQEVVNKIAEMFPELITGYNDEGLAILSAKGNVEALTEAYKEQEQAANKALIAGQGKVWEDFENQHKGFAGLGASEVYANKQIADAVLNTLYGTGSNTFILPEVSSDLAIGDMLPKDTLYAFTQILDDMDIKYDIFGSDLKEVIAKNLNRIEDQAQSYIESYNNISNPVKTALDAYLDLDLDYASLNTKVKNVVDKIVGAFDAEFIQSFGSITQLEEYVSGMVDNIQNFGLENDLLQFEDAISNYNNNEFTVDEYIQEINKFKNALKESGLDDQTINRIELAYEVDEQSLQDGLTTAYGRVQYILDDKFDDQVGQLSKTDLEIAMNIVAAEGSLTFDELIEKIKTAKEEALSFNLSDYESSIDSIQEKISNYESFYEKVQEDSMTTEDILDFMQQYPDAVNEIDPTNMKELSEYLRKAIQNAPKDLVSELIKLREELRAAGKETKSIDLLITSLRNLPVDTIGEMSAKYYTLTDAIDESTKAQEKLQQAMDQNPNEAYENRSEAIEEIKRLLQLGEIGSESSIWDIAEAIGFTYDSEDTINGNAEALENFVNVREKFFSKNDDGDYTFEGTENFIKAVETAVANSPELQKLGVIWNYDNGSFLADFNNIDFSTFVSELAKTKELAGLTSAEFMDMLTQIGQYFDINWADSFDVIDLMSSLEKEGVTASERMAILEQSIRSIFEEEGIPFAESFLTTNRSVEDLDEGLRRLILSYRELRDMVVNDPMSITETLNAGFNKGDTVLSDESIDALSYVTSVVRGNDGTAYIDFEQLKYDAQKAGMNVEGLVAALEQYGTSVVKLKVDNENDPFGLRTFIDDADGALRYLDALNIEASKLDDGTIGIDLDYLVNALTVAGYSAEQIKSQLESLPSQYVLTTVNENDKPIKINVDDTLVTEAIENAQALNGDETVTVNIDGTAKEGIQRLLDNMQVLTEEVWTVRVGVQYDKNALYNSIFGSNSGNGNTSSGTNKKSSSSNGAGTAHAQGSWGAPKTETALVGELGRR